MLMFMKPFRDHTTHTHTERESESEREKRETVVCVNTACAHDSYLQLINDQLKITVNDELDLV